MSQSYKEPQTKEEAAKAIVDKISLKQSKVKTRGANQQKLYEAILSHDLTICKGPAGSGKTHVAVGIGITRLIKGEFDKLIITRPAVTTEEFGYLPGDMNEKMDPFVRPIYDELEYFISPAERKRLMLCGVIEICPFAYMRGRTFKNAYILCDECQNATFGQIEMLLTRLGIDSRMVITGDIDQCDLKQKDSGGLEYAYNIYKGSEAIACVELEKSDIVRHPLLDEIISKWKNFKNS